MNEYLSLKQRHTLDLSYGMDGAHPMIDKEIRELFGVTGSNIQAIRKYSLKKLRLSKWGMSEGKNHINSYSQKTLGGIKYGTE